MSMWSHTGACAKWAFKECDCAAKTMSNVAQNYEPNFKGEPILNNPEEVCTMASNSLPKGTFIRRAFATNHASECDVWDLKVCNCDGRDIAARLDDELCSPCPCGSGVSSLSCKCISGENK